MVVIVFFNAKVYNEVHPGGKWS